MQTQFISVDPIMRVWLQGARTYLPPLKLQDTLHAFCISTPINNPNQFYFGATGIQSHFYLEDQSFIVKIPRQITDEILNHKLSPSIMLNIIINAFPCYFGLSDAQPGQTILISTAAGATGILAIQIGTILGCNVIGLTSSYKKIDLIKQNFPEVQMVNYNDQNWVKQILNYAPKGINIYFDNVGGEYLDQVLNIMQDLGKIVLCGVTSTYNKFSQRNGLSNYQNIITKRLILQGVTFYHESPLIMREVQDKILQWIFEGRIKIFQTIYDGIQNFETCLMNLFQGKNTGKQIIQLINLPKF